MNNKEFMTVLSGRLGLSVSQTAQLTETFLSEFIEQLESGNMIACHGFGAFEVKKKAERISVNPATQVRMLVPPKLSLGFKPSSTLKEKFKSTSSETS